MAPWLLTSQALTVMSGPRVARQALGSVVWIKVSLYYRGQKPDKLALCERMTTPMRTTRFLVIAIAVAAVAFAVFTVSGGAASKKTSNWRAKISPDLLDQIDSGSISTMAAQDRDQVDSPDKDQVDVIVQFDGAVTAAHGQTIQGLGGKVKKSYS